MRPEWGKAKIAAVGGEWAGLKRKWDTSAYCRPAASREYTRVITSTEARLTAPAVAAMLIECEIAVNKCLVSSACAARVQRHLVGLHVCTGARAMDYPGASDTTLWLPLTGSIAAPLRVTVVRSEPVGRVVRVMCTTRVLLRIRFADTTRGPYTPAGNKSIAEPSPAWYSNRTNRCAQCTRHDLCPTQDTTGCGDPGAGGTPVGARRFHAGGQDQERSSAPWTTRLGQDVCMPRRLPASGSWSFCRAPLPFRARIHRRLRGALSG
mmetsp:Transcript_14551/g.45037  ORF Transcript_14551/g.45037 Transcript_14551/m.45037 type:complete len:265 (-) Transcript_14551:1481-2275(-)